MVLTETKLDRSDREVENSKKSNYHTLQWSCMLAASRTKRGRSMRAKDNGILKMIQYKRHFWRNTEEDWKNTMNWLFLFKTKGEAHLMIFDREETMKHWHLVIKCIWKTSTALLKEWINNLWLSSSTLYISKLRNLMENGRIGWWINFMKGKCCWKTVHYKIFGSQKFL